VFEVKGRMVGSKKVKKIRAHLYDIASDNCAFVVADYRSGEVSHREAIKYDGSDLTLSCTFWVDRVRSSS